MRDNCMVFTDKTKREVRVVFEPDGTPLFVGMDLAAIAGYKAPSKAVSRSQLRKRDIGAVKRLVEWKNETRRGFVEAYCFTAEDAKRFLWAKPIQNEAVKWFVGTVIPEANAIGREAAENATTTPKSPQAPPQKPGPPAIQLSIADRLDAIILECALLKKELCQTK